jgi:hypothetical protein
VSENRELDAQVAEQVMGWRNISNAYVINGLGGDDPAQPNRGIQRVPRYSESIEAAMEVVEKLGRRVDIQFFPGHISQWRVMFINPTEEGAWAVTLPEAICRAALAAVKDQNGEGAQ